MNHNHDINAFDVFENFNITYYYDDEFDDNFDDEGSVGSAEILGTVIGTVFGIVTVTWFCVVARRNNWWMPDNDHVSTGGGRPISEVEASIGNFAQGDVHVAEATISPLYTHTEASISRDELSPASVEVELSPIASSTTHSADDSTPEATEIPVASAI